MSFFFFTFLLFTPACSNVFYQPSSKLFYQPEQFNLSYENILFYSQDGTQLHGWFFPSKSKVNPKGTVIQFHGNAENISTHFLSLSWLVKHGYNLFIFDYRGYGKSEGSPSQEGMHMDALAALTQVIALNHQRKELLNQQTLRSEREKDDKLKLIVFGQSIGGTIVLSALNDFEDAEEIDAIVVESSFLSYKEIAKEKLSLAWLTWLFQPLAYFLVSDRFSPNKTLKDLPQIPLLIIHGDNDPIVPLHHGENIFKKANPPKLFWRIEGGKHIGSMSYKNGLYKKKLLKFFEDL